MPTVKESSRFQLMMPQVSSVLTVAVSLMMMSLRDPVGVSVATIDLPNMTVPSTSVTPGWAKALSSSLSIADRREELVDLGVGLGDLLRVGWSATPASSPSAPPGSVAVSSAVRSR